MSHRNPLGLVGYGDDDDEDDSEVDEEPQQSKQREEAGSKGQSPLEGGAMRLVPGASLDGESEDAGADLYDDLIGEQAGDASGDDGPSPVGRADAVDAQTDGVLAPSPSQDDKDDPAREEGGEKGTSGATEELTRQEEEDERLKVPPPAGPCPEWLQERVKVILEKQRATGKSVLKVLRDNRTYRNPAFMEKVVAHYGVAQYGSSFPKDKFDPKALPKEDTYLELKRALDEKREERRRARIEHQHTEGRTIAMPSHSTPAANIDIAAVQARVAKRGGAQSGPVGNASKRSKWDRA